jgi:CheY-like chemotaxis protein
MTHRLLIIDDDPATETALRSALTGYALSLDVATDSRLAIEQLETGHYDAIVLDPMIRHRLNGYAVLNHIELERPDLLSRVFVWTGMSKQTIARTAPALVPRSFRKPSEVAPLAEALLASIEPPWEQQSRSKGSVLLVEDDPVTAKATKDLLEELGYSCEWVGDARGVLETASAYDVIMLDLVMPEVDGFTLLQHLRASRPELLRRVLITTGMPGRYLSALDQERLCGVVQKPVDVHVLQRMLGRCGSIVTPEPAGECPSIL